MADEDGVCDELEVGCTDPNNPGYNPNATEENGSCLVGGCVFPTACNYDVNADYQIGGTCDFTSCVGCTDPASCNYDANATQDNGICSYPQIGYDCDGACLNDSDNDGVCDAFEVMGCTDPGNPGYNPWATEDDGSCLVGGCTLPFACNYDENADYIIFTDVNLLHVRDVQMRPLVTMMTDLLWTMGHVSMLMKDTIVMENADNDTDGDGVCDGDEVLGCTDPSNPGFNPWATEDDGSCFIGGCIIPVACNYNPNADYLDPSMCDFTSCADCFDATACNYNPDTVIANNQRIIPNMLRIQGW